MEDGSKKKKTRTVFSRRQIFQLEEVFDANRYLSLAKRAALANKLGLSETQIKIWFQNRRNKWKRQLETEYELASMGYATRQENTAPHGSLPMPLAEERSASIPEERITSETDATNFTRQIITSHIDATGIARQRINPKIDADYIPQKDDNNIARQRIFSAPFIYHEKFVGMTGQSWVGTPQSFTRLEYPRVISSFSRDVNAE